MTGGPSGAYRIAVIPGDGIGTEVVPEGLAALRATADVYGLGLRFDEFDFASARYWQENGTMLPPDWEGTLRSYDAIFFGAVGRPAVVPDHISLWGACCSSGAPSTSTSTCARAG